MRHLHPCMHVCTGAETCKQFTACVKYLDMFHFRACAIYCGQDFDGRRRWGSKAVRLSWRCLGFTENPASSGDWESCVLCDAATWRCRWRWRLARASRSCHQKSSLGICLNSLVVSCVSDRHGREWGQPCGACYCLCACTDPRSCSGAFTVVDSIVFFQAGVLRISPKSHAVSLWQSRSCDAVRR